MPRALDRILTFAPRGYLSGLSEAPSHCKAGVPRYSVHGIFRDVEADNRFPA